jgi:GT2 family glycosyltransferase
VDEPKPLTVAVPSCNGARHLPAALRSICAQEGVAFDLVVADDRSDDETLAVVRSIAGDRARVAVNSERLGLAGNWNRCVALSRTPLVAIFHQDDVMSPGHLRAHAAAFAAGAGLGLVCGAADVIDERGDAVPAAAVGRGDLGPSDRWFPPGGFVAALAAANPVRCSSATIRAAAHADVGGFDPSYRYAVDWDFWIRLARRWGVAWLARPTVAVRWHPASETHRFKAGTDDLEEQIRLLAALDAREGRRPSVRRAADHRLARAFLNRAHDALRGGDAALARRCLRRAVGLRPGIVGTIARDPRLAAQMAAVAVAPRAAARLFARRG